MTEPRDPGERAKKVGASIDIRVSSSVLWKAFVAWLFNRPLRITIVEKPASFEA